MLLYIINSSYHYRLLRNRQALLYGFLYRNWAQNRMGFSIVWVSLSLRNRQALLYENRPLGNMAESP